MKKLLVALASFCYLGIVAYAQVGTIDASFGNSGAYTFPLNTGINGIRASNMLVLSNDQIIVSTDEEYASFLYKGKLNKLTANGALDVSFGTSGFTMVDDSTFGYGNVIQMPNGKFLASWHKNNPNITVADDYPFLTMHNADASLVTTFGTNGRLDLPASPTGGTIGSTLAADANNNFYVLYDYNNGEVIRSYTSTGAINTAFGSGGTLSFADEGYTQMIYSPTSGGRLILGRYDIDGNLSISQYLLNGQLDFTYGSAGYVTIPYLMATPDGMELYTMGLQSDGKLLVHVLEYNTSDVLSRVARINTDGTLDPTFNNNAQIATAPLTSQIFVANKMIQQVDGKIVLGGANMDLNTENTQKAFFRLNGDGTFDNTFGTNGLLSLGTFNGEGISDVNIQSTGKIIGLVNNDNNTAVYILRLLNNLNVGVLDNLNLHTLGLYPNPVQSSFELGYTLKETQTVSIDLRDMQGRIIRRFQENQSENGEQTHTFYLPATLAPGMYTVSIHTMNSLNSLQIIVK